LAEKYIKRGSRRGRRRRKGSLALMHDLLPKTVKRLKLTDHFNKLNIERHYKDIFGDDIANASNPDKIIKGTLHINVSSSAWLMQLSYMQDEFKDKINERLGKKIVKRIHFKIGKLTKSEKFVEPVTQVSLTRVKLTADTKKLIKERVKDIKDNVLKKSIISAETAYYKRKLTDED